MSIIRQSIKGSFVNYIGIVIGAIVTLYLAPKFFTTEYNGLYRLLLEYSVVLGNYFSFGIPKIINKFFFDVFDEEKSRKGFGFFIFVLPLLIVFFFFLIGLGYREEIASLVVSGSEVSIVSKYILFVFPLIFVNAYLAILESFTAMYGNIVLINFLRSVILKVFSVISMLLYVFVKDFEIVMWVIVVSNLLVTLIAFIKALKFVAKGKLDLLKPSLSFVKQNKIKKDFFRYFFFLLVSNIFVFLISKIDLFFVGKYTGLSNLAYYTIAMYFISLMIVPFGMITKISFPQIMKAYKMNEAEKLARLIQGNGLYGYILSFFVFLFVWVNIDLVYTVIPNGNLYSSGKSVFLILGVGRLLEVSSGAVNMLLVASKWYMHTFYISVIVSIVSIFLGYYLTLNFEIYGSAVAMTITVILSVALNVYIVYSKMKLLPYNYKHIIILLLGGVVSVIALFVDLLNLQSIWINSFCKTTFLVLVYCYGVYYFKVSEEVNKLITHLVFSIKKVVGYIYVKSKI